jgi:hypothetical protein
MALILIYAKYPCSFEGKKHNHYQHHRGKRQDRIFHELENLPLGNFHNFLLEF